MQAYSPEVRFTPRKRTGWPAALRILLPEACNPVMSDAGAARAGVSTGHGTIAQISASARLRLRARPTRCQAGRACRVSWIPRTAAVTRLDPPAMDDSLSAPSRGYALGTRTEYSPG